MKKIEKKNFSIILLVSVLFLAYFPITVNKIEINEIFNTQTKTDQIPIEFSHSEQFNIEIEENKLEAEDFNGSEFLNGLSTFNESVEVNVFSNSSPDSVDGINLKRG